jgi:hypothetical protein
MKKIMDIFSSRTYSFPGQVGETVRHSAERMGASTTLHRAMLGTGPTQQIRGDEQ